VLTRRVVSLADLLLFAQAWLMLLVVDVALRTVPFSRLDRTLLAVSKPRIARAIDNGEVDRIHSIVEAAARRHLVLVDASCLRRALVLRCILGGRGASTRLQLGVRKAGSELVAHAWLELYGQPIGQAQDPRDAFATLENSHTLGN
jgi:hypothetical protein